MVPASARLGEVAASARSGSERLPAALQCFRRRLRSPRLTPRPHPSLLLVRAPGLALRMPMTTTSV